MLTELQIHSFFLPGNDSDNGNGLHPYRIAYTHTFGKPPWYDWVRDEYSACREAVGISDYSSFTKIDLWVSLNPLIQGIELNCFIKKVFIQSTKKANIQI